DGLIAMGLILPGHELEYEGRPPVFDVGCVGQILTHDKMPGGIYNILLQGVRRMKIVSELPPDRPFRLVQAEPLDDDYSAAGELERPARRQRLVDSFKGAMPGSPSVHLGLDHLLGSDLSLGELTDIVAYTIDLDLALKQTLLAEPNVDARAEHLIRALSPQGDLAKKRFPPDFSTN
ncbi:MAG TPA: LON peptidase substrate-binding domain-containing protein, partial [Pirellulales bacterium]